MISKKMLEEYKQIYKKEFGKDISDKEACEHGTDLIKLVEIIIEHMIKTEKNTKELVKDIVKKAQALKDQYTDEGLASVNYACIFSQDEDEYQKLMRIAKVMGKMIKTTQSGNLYKINPIETSAGQLKLLKIRMPDVTRPERGDADFTVSDYPKFKEKHLPKEGFKLIERPDMEMIELIDPDFDVRAYFSHPPLDTQICGSGNLAGNIDIKIRIWD